MVAPVAHVRRVTITARDRPLASWTVDTTPMLLVDAEVAALYVVTNVVRIADGTMAVACDEDIRLFDTTGKAVCTVGRKG